MVLIKKNNTIKFVSEYVLKPNDEIIGTNNKTYKITRILKGGKNGN